MFKKIYGWVHCLDIEISGHLKVIRGGGGELRKSRYGVHYRSETVTNDKESSVLSGHSRDRQNKGLKGK